MYINRTAKTVVFLSTLSLRRATKLLTKWFCNSLISIHALLAESDLSMGLDGRFKLYFYPRSPCGERQHAYQLVLWVLRFLSTLSLRRATREPTAFRTPHHRFLSTLSLRRATSSTRIIGFSAKVFLSTLSLRRATILHMAHLMELLFLSTLSLRRATA